MLKFKTATPSVEQLEEDLAERRVDLDKARADYREARLAFEDAKGLVADSDSLDNLAAHRSALEDVQAASAAVGLATDNVRAADRALRDANTGTLCYREYLYSKVTRCSLQETVYQLAGPKQKRREAFFDPGVVPDPRTWLEERLGPLAAFEVVA